MSEVIWRTKAIFGCRQAFQSFNLALSKSQNLLGFSSHRKKKMKQLNKKIKTGKMEIDEENPFEMFIASTNIRYCYYHETHKILGNTYGMCVLQDFEAMTPNLLARTIETVEGGGAIVLLVHSVDSLKQLYTLSMDVHSR